MVAGQSSNGVPLLRVSDLRAHFFLARGVAKAVDGVSFTLDAGEVLGLVGESACGKSVTALSILRLVPNPPGRIVGGSIQFEGEELLSKSEGAMRKMRGSRITMIQQNPDTCLNPVFRIGDQVGEAIAIHQGLRKQALHEKVLRILRLVRIASPEVRVLSYPHEMSGGMRQRVAGAIALSCEAKLVIADEPTTNLDVTTQIEYLKLLEEIQASTNTAILFISHDFGVVARICDRVAVMYAGKIVESGPTREVIASPAHPYTAALLASLPRPESRADRLLAIDGAPPDPVDLPACCAFAQRCPDRDRRCFETRPMEVQIGDGRFASCFHV